MHARTAHQLAWLLVAFALPACSGHAPSSVISSTPTPTTSTRSPAEQALLDVCKKARAQASRRADPHEDLDGILWQQTAAEYRGSATTIYRAAAEALPALERANQTGKPSVVVFDLDETVLDNSRFQGRLLHEARNYESALWDCWIGQRQARAVPGMERLFGAMVAEGVRGRFITNRKCRLLAGDSDPCPQEADTLANLNALLAKTGYVATAEELMLSAEKEPAMATPWDDEKQARRDFVSQTSEIVMLLGDDLGDFLPDVRKASIAARGALLARVEDRWGSSWFLLPNPNYGSWVTAVDLEAVAIPARKRHEVVEAFAYPEP